MAEIIKNENIKNNPFYRLTTPFLTINFGNTHPNNVEYIINDLLPLFLTNVPRNLLKTLKKKGYWRNSEPLHSKRESEVITDFVMKYRCNRLHWYIDNQYLGAELLGYIHKTFPKGIGNNLTSQAFGQTCLNRYIKVDESSDMIQVASTHRYFSRERHNFLPDVIDHFEGLAKDGIKTMDARDLLDIYSFRYHLTPRNPTDPDFIRLNDLLVTCLDHFVNAGSSSNSLKSLTYEVAKMLRDNYGTCPFYVSKYHYEKDAEIAATLAIIIDEYRGEIRIPDWIYTNHHKEIS